MSFGSWIGQRLVKLGNRAKYRQFCHALENPEACQREQLGGILAELSHTTSGVAQRFSEIKNYEEFCELVPLSDYKDYQTLIVEQQKTQRPVLTTETLRFQPTSGFQGHLKWIPYSPKLLREFDNAASAWMYDMACENPRILRGAHYWSLSWLPNDLRLKSASNNDLDIFPLWKKVLLSQVMATPSGLERIETSENVLFATLAYLASREDLSFISVWSPTFLLMLMTAFYEQRKELSRVLAAGDWGERGLALQMVKCPRSKTAAACLENMTLDKQFFKKLWPELSLISAWDSAASKPLADKLQSYFPRTRFQGKGLWATEGVVTIPFQGKYPVALTSHFFEFKCLSTGAIFPTWHLEQGQVVQPLLTTGGGFLRYALQDKLKVTGFLKRCPTLEFLGRLNGCDLVGEKITSETASEVLRGVESEIRVDALSLVACRDLAQYILLGGGNPQDSAKASEVTERRLQESFHYRLARELGQLRPAGALLSSDPVKIYHEFCADKGMLLGNIKPEPLVECDSWRAYDRVTES